MHREAPPGRPQGVRERSKLERQGRIIQAARTLFTERGYDAATLSAIAGAAGLSKGTIFNYVTDKRDIIFLIFHDEMSSVVDEALAATGPEHIFLDRILAIAELHYRLFATHPRLSRILLNETLIHSEGMHLEKYLLLRDRLISGIERMVAEAQKRGTVSIRESARFIAHQIYLIFSAAFSEWLLAPEPEWRLGLRQFKRSLKLFLQGAGAGSEAVPVRAEMKSLRRSAKA